MGESNNSTILVVDDDPVLRESVAAYLEDSNFNVIQATNGREGLEQFTTLSPDLALLDLRMPVMDGIEALPLLVEARPDTPVIIVSGMGTLDDAIEALRLGAWDFITKPVHDLAFLEHSVKRALERAKLIEENKRYREHLEEEVSIRTEELANRNVELEQNRKKIQQAARDWDDAFNAVQDPLFIHDEHFRIVNANHAYFERTGLSRDEVLGRVYWELFPKSDGPLDGCVEALETKRASKASEITTDAGEVFLSRSFVVLGDGKHYKHSVHILQDITERKWAQEALRSSEERYRLIFEQGGDSIVLVDPRSGEILDFNEQTYSNLGYSKVEFANLKVPDFEVTESVEEVQRHFEKILQTGSDVFETKHRTKDGELRDVQVTARKITLGGNPYIQAIFTDFTERKHAEEERRKNIERLHGVLVKTIQAIALTVEKRDPYTAGHQERVSDLASAIAIEMGLNDEQVEGIRMGAMIHDIGKVYVPGEFLNRPGKLSADEFSIIKTHAQVGYDIVRDIDFSWPVAEMILQHHERMDGSGYPNGIKGDQIILEARIMAVADVVEAISSHRPYRPGLGMDVALGEITDNRTTLYDPDVVDACLRLFNEKGYVIEH
ncbi:MAG: HD domain-containing phosphohydrolase [Candidatus Sedimenticola sp. 20ELBAFRAG]